MQNLEDSARTEVRASAMNIENSVALVTGGAVRIGRAIVEVLSARGCGVAIHCNRSVAEARALACAIASRGGRAWVIRGDLASPAACERMIEEVWTKAGRLDILINNASVFHKQSLTAMTAAALKSELDINLVAPIMLTRAFATRLGSRPSRRMKGKVVNLLDRRISGNEADCIPYLLSKKALGDFTKSAAVALAPGITVNAVAPGAILPPRIGGGRAKAMDVARELAGPVPLRRQCTPAEVAHAVMFLLDNDAVTGQIIFVDGGQNLLGTMERLQRY